MTPPPAVDPDWHRLAAGVVVDTGRTLATKLSPHLYGESPARSGPLDAFRLARRTFLAGERVDMGVLAGALGVDRATLFRWVGNRDQLLSEVIWSLCYANWRQAIDAATGTGTDRILRIFHFFTQAVMDAEYFRAYLDRERERALRLLSTRAGVQHARVTALFHGLLEVEQQVSGIVLPLPADDTAYLMTRLGEMFIYADLIIGEEPDATKATAAVAAILGAVPSAPPSTTTPPEEQ
ncbi:TetR family transcriptional regulator [Actinocorallia herbida]|uniref:TetR family transcriptional regulator n=1 Tax=Actinocorallia herbida TaxID=58109 RepID=A0A3N1CT48_9ACTN|nr:QsdR family transcriptional regulator [Actinocorallia herbida]ROO84492.1 TetR family transcriptional regulator [Actinocorallia herbida]